MKTKVLKSLLTIACLLCSIGGYAHDFEVDGIYYQITAENEVDVTYYGDDMYNVPDEFKYTGSVVIPETIVYNGNTYKVTSIVSSAFYYCSGLTSIDIHDTVSIGQGAFYRCTSLTTVNIPACVTSLDYATFYGCSALTRIDVAPTTPPVIGNYVFFNVDKTIPVYVPEGCGEAYRSASGWSDFTQIIEFTPEITATWSIAEGTELKSFQSVDITFSGVESAKAKGTYSCFYFWEKNANGEWQHVENGCTAGYMDTEADGATVTFSADPGCYGEDFVSPFNRNGEYRIIIPAGDIFFNGDRTNVSTVDYVLNFTIKGDPAPAEIDAAFTADPANNSSISALEKVVLTFTDYTSIEIAELDLVMGTNIPYVYLIDELTGQGMPAGYIFFRAGAAANQLELYVDSDYNGGYPSYNLEGQYKVIIPKKVVKFSDGVSGEIVLNYTVKGATTQVGDKFTVDSVHYIVTAETEVAVTYYGENKTNVPYEYKYTGAVVIPPNVIYEGITYKVTSIGDYTFYRNTGLKEVTIPEGVTSIGDEAFRACSGLTKVIIPEGVTSINKYAFANCTGLREITIPNSVTSIGEYAFWVCEGLKEVVIPSSVTSMGVAAFSSCSGLTSITILEGVTLIGENAFISCTGLTEVIIPGSVISIGAGAFSGCSGLTSVSIGNGVTSLGKSAFSSCTGLTEVSIGNSVTSIGNNAFSSCTGLTEITIPNSVISIGENAFISCTGLTEISIGNGIASIGRSAFWGCTNLKNIVIPKSVTSIGEYPFCDCTSLAEIVVEAGNTIYDSRKNCNAIIETTTNTIIVGCQNTVIPEGVVSIGVAAFSGSTGLREITIPSSVASICDYAFQNCTNLAEICVEATTPPAIGSYAFYGVDKSIPVYIPVGCAEAYSSANGWSEFDLIEIEPEDVTPQVGDKFTVDGVYYQITAENEVAVTFYGSLPIATPEEYKYTGAVVIPESVSYQGVTCRVASIGQSAFYSCSGLTSIALPEGLISIGMGAFENCAGLTSVTIPASVTSIGFNAFGNCAGLTSVSIGNDVKEIGGWAFSGCNGLTSVTIPSSVTSIGDYAFSLCNGLIEIRVEATTPPTIELAFDGLDKSIPVYVPAGCGEAYRSATGWSEFTNIIEGKQGDFTHQIGDKFTVDGVHYQIATKTEVAVTFYGDGGFYVPLKYEYTGAVVIPESVTYQGVTYSVTSIGESAFNNSANLTSVTIPSSVTSIGEYAFFLCTSLTSVTIPSSVASIGSGIFGGCSGLTSIRVEDGNTVYDSRDNCNAIIETATNNLIAGCKNTVISGSVTSIGKSAFHSIGLISITIPEGVTLIDEFAFTGCNNLTEIRIKAVNPPTVEIAAFERVDKSIPVYVPVGCGEAYRSATGWSEFTNIIEDVIPENYLVANDVEVVILDGIIKQSEISFSVSLNNSVEIAGLQCDVYLPDGLTPKMQGEKYDIVLSSRAQGFDVVAKLRNDGALRLVIFSTSLDAISSNKGELFTIMLQANEQYSTDDKIVIRNIVMTASDFAEYECPELEVACVLKESCSGDVNRDGNTNITDVVITVAKILGMYDGNFDAEAADANQDGVLDIADVAELINLILDHDNAPQRACAQGEYEKGNLAMNDTEIVQGASKQIAVDLLNTAPYTAFQMDVRLPEGLVLEDVVAGDRTNSHSLQWREQADGRVRILGYSLSNELIDNDGETLLNLVLRADGEPGEGEVVIDGIIFVTNDIVTHQLDRATGKVCVVTALNDVVTATRIYAADHKVVVDSPVAQVAAISPIDGMVQRVALQAGRNEIPLQQGIYIVAVETEVKKVVIR